MPSQHARSLRTAHPSLPTFTPIHQYYPLTPPADNRDHAETEETDALCPDHSDGINRVGVSDNTAAGMSLMQEESMYPSHETYTLDNSMDLQESAEKEKPTIHSVSVTMTAEDQLQDNNQMHQAQQRSTHQLEDEQLLPSNTIANRDGADQLEGSQSESICLPTPIQQVRAATSEVGAMPRKSQSQLQSESSVGKAIVPGLSVSRNYDDADYGTKPWDFTKVPLSTHYPSSLLHPGSKFEGTQQSDRQIYNVTVTVHTVDVPEAKISGYLKIEGLTPDHPTLTTFFTGEIIGGPDQKYSFQTKHPRWGATDKDDLNHWARFDAWRPLNREAKRDINFQHPPPGTGMLGQESWWEQQHIFMRWKEWFLVPDHRVRSIQGASFEGFYYICFDQIEGKISGIYFHARSEKYQQLELKHEGEKGAWNKGIRPAMEFR